MCIICPSVLESRVSTWDSSSASEVYARWLWWRGKHGAVPTWSRRWKRESWIQHLSTQTYTDSHSTDIEDWWTSSLEASHASHSPTQDSVKVLRMTGTSGQSSERESECSSLWSASGKTSKASSQQSHQATTRFSTMCSVTWKSWVSEQRQDASQRRKSVHHISESGGSSARWPTPTTQESPHQNMEICPKSGRRISKNGTTHSLSLQDTVALNWPTPTGMHAQRGNHDEPLQRYQQRVMDYQEGRAKGKQGMSLGVAVRWPTPTAAEDKYRLQKGPHNSLSERCLGALARSGQLDVGSNSGAGSMGGQLNPAWVDQLMGFPTGWTDSVR
jgi:hypothetical protein